MLTEYGMVAVPPQDSALNVLSRDVVGNKTDTIAGTSLYARLLQALAVSSGALPAQDAIANLTPADVIGNKTDTHNGDSLYALLHTLIEHNHSPSYTYPTLAAGVAVIGGAGAWALGALTQVVPAATILQDFDIHYIGVETISVVDVFEIQFFYGAADTFAGSCRFSRQAAQEGTQNVPIHTPVIPAGSRIRAQIASASGGADTATVSIFYHLY